MAKHMAFYKEVAMLHDLNVTRAAAGLPALELDSKLCEVAEEHGDDMARRNYFDHVSPEGLSPFDRMRAASIPFSWAGENIAMSPGESEAYLALINSVPHFENIIQPNFRHVGIAAVQEADGEWLFVQDFTN